MAHANNARNLIILGAAGRDFHDFNVYWKSQPGYKVVAFTAAQIPDIAGRVYPSQLAGPRYPKGIPIEPESGLPQLIKKLKVDEAVMAYSDLSHADVMHKASIVNAAGADFKILGWRRTMLDSRKPVIAVGAVRTGCGKSQTTRKVSQYLKALGLKVAVVRHPMPYGDLTKQICQRFACLDDMDHHKCTIEEREEYEPHINAGNVLFAGVDYERILRAAEAEADVVLWDGGNNDMPFYRPDLFIVVTDPLRPGHETAYYPGETNLRMADVVVINKIDTARREDIAVVEANIRRANPAAAVVKAKSPVTVADPRAVRGKRVLVVEDGPTLTHGGMTFGAAHVAARDCGARKIVDPRPYAVGSIKKTFQAYPHLTDILPAMGYGARQMEELRKTIDATPCDLVVVGTPIDLTRLLSINKPSVRVTYELDETDGALRRLVERTVAPRLKGCACGCAAG
ncbi:MAG: GTPase [Elusimicrobia bacterium]|nr:GTPase [Elusimicrobiota bacterium]